MYIKDKPIIFFRTGKRNKKKLEKYTYYWRQKLAEEKDKLKSKTQKNCIFCEKPSLRKNFRDAEKTHCVITGKYCGAVHNDCNFKLKINPKTLKIPVVFHNLKGYDAHLIMQEM